MVMNMDFVKNVLSVVLFFFTATVAHPGGRCITDRDCLLPQTYCYISGVCAPCTDCKIYQRNPGQVCAKTKDQCGPCLPGMQAETNIDGTLSVCHKIGSVPDNSHSKEEKDNNDNIINNNTQQTIGYIALGVFVVVAILLLLYFIIFHKKCDCTSLQSSVVNRIFFLPYWRDGCPREGAEYPQKPPSAPPYEPSPPSPASTPLIQQVIRPLESDRNQQAVPYAPPCYVLQPSEDVIPTATPPETEQIPLLPESEPIPPDDEETMPSSWTPAQQSGGQLVQNFENLLSTLATDQLVISQPGYATGNTQPTGNGQPGTENSPNSGGNGGNIVQNIQIHTILNISNNKNN